MQLLYHAVGPEPERMPLPRPKGVLSVEKVLAGAPGGKSLILRNVSLTLGEGEVLGVVGPSASGKSSLARVLVGVWQVASGAVRLDGFELSQWDPQELGKHVGYLPQDVELFAGSVAENIARFSAVDNEAVIDAAQLAGCHELIQTLPDGYNTNIGDSGQALSGGQRQRIALARCLYRSPSFLVLDEPNANLDSVGEEALLWAIHRLKAAGTTVVLITHKLNILSVVDKIVILGDGMVQAFGDKEEVLRQPDGPKVIRTDAASHDQPGSSAQRQAIDNAMESLPAKNPSGNRNGDAPAASVVTGDGRRPEPETSWVRVAAVEYGLIILTFGVLGGWAAIAKIDRAVVGGRRGRDRHQSQDGAAPGGRHCPRDPGQGGRSGSAGQQFCSDWRTSRRRRTTS